MYIPCKIKSFVVQIITKTSELQEKLAKIKATQEFVTVDTEFVRERTYYPNLGLIQIGCSNEEFVIDPLAEGIDLKPINDLFQDEKIIKVFHAAQQDLEIVLNTFGELPKNIFDTQIACKFLGFGEAVSYGKLVEQFCNSSVDKSARFTDWLKRPLDDSQVAYALDDVIHLREIYEKIKAVLEKKGRFSWVLEETSKLLDEKLYRTEPEEAWKKMKFKSTEGKYLNLIKELAKWRETRAKEINRPRMWILKDDAIQEITHVRPRTTEELKGLRFFKYDERIANEIIAAVERGLNSKDYIFLEKNISISENMMPIVTLLKLLLKNQGIENGVAPSVIADIDDLKMIAVGDFKGSKTMEGWRHDIFGSFAKKLVEGKVALSAKGRNVFIIDLEAHFT